MFRNLGPMEILIILLIIMVLFGGKKIPELMHGLGKGINEFKRASQAPADEAAKTETTTTTTTAPAAPKV
jgi:sec-independent protein translocase protein TatA